MNSKEDWKITEKCIKFSKSDTHLEQVMQYSNAEQTVGLEEVLQNLNEIKSYLKNINERLNILEYTTHVKTISETVQVYTFGINKDEKKRTGIEQQYENLRSYKCDTKLQSVMQTKNYLTELTENLHVFEKSVRKFPVNDSCAISLPLVEESTNDSNNKAQTYESFTRLNCGISNTYFCSPFVKKTTDDESPRMQNLRVPKDWHQTMNRKLRPSLRNADDET